MNTLTKKDVLEATEELISSGKQADGDGSYTTTLDVKRYLRGDGFWATQSLVSDAMNEIHQDGDLGYTDNGTYRHYHLPNQQSMVVNTTVVNASVASITVGPITPTTIQDVEELPQPVDGCWLVFDYDGEQDSFYIGGNVSRNVARAYYEKKMSVAYAKVGATVYKQ